MIRQLLIVILCASPLALVAQDAEMEDFAAKLAAQARGGGKSLAVVKFTNEQGYDSGFSKYLADRLTRLLVNRGSGLQLQNHAQVQAVSRELGLHYTDELNTAAVKALVGKLNVDMLITGSFSVTQRSVTVDASILDGRTGNMVGAQTLKLNRQDVGELLVKVADPIPAAAPSPAGRQEIPANQVVPGQPVGDPGAPPPGGVDARRVAIPAQTPIKTRVLQNLSSVGLRATQKIVTHLSDPIVVNGVTVASPDAEVVLSVADVGTGRLRLHLESVKMFDGTVVLVRANDYLVTAPKSSVLGNILFRKPNQPLQMPPAQIAANSVIVFTPTDDVPWH